MRKLFALLLLVSSSSSLWAQQKASTTIEKGEAARLFEKAEELFTEQPDSAMKYYQAVLPIANKELNWDLYVKSACIIYRILNDRNAYEKMQDYAQKAFQIAIKHLSPRETIFIAAINNLGTYHYSKGDYDMAASIMRQAIELLEAQEETNPIHLAKCYGNLGRYHQKRGDYNEGLQYYKTAARIKAAHEATYSGLSRAVSQHLIGRTFMALNQTDSAVQYFYKAQSLLSQHAEAQYQRKNLDVRLSLIDAFLHIEQTDSVAYYLKNLSRFQTHTTALQEARLWGLKARLASDQKDYDTALVCLERARQIREKKYGPQHAENADLLRQIGDIYQKNHRFKKAIETYEAGLSILARPAGESIISGKYRNPTDAFSLLQSLAAAHEQNNAPQKAIQSYQAAADLISFIRSSFYSLEAKNFWNEGRFVSVFESIVRICEQEYRLTQERKYFEQAFLAAEANKAFSLYENQQKQLARIQTQLPDTVWKEGQKIEREIQFYQQKLWAAEAKGKSKNTNYKEKLFSWQQARDRWQANLQAEYPDYYQKTLASIDLLSIDSLQQQLAPSSLLVEYFRAGTSYYRFSISQASLDFTQLGAEGKSLDAQLDSIYQVLFVQEPSLDALPPFASLSSKLYQHLLGESLEDSRFAELIVIADGQIGYLPFEILTKNLVKPKPESSVRQWREYPYLLHDYAIQYAYSASLLFRSKTKTDLNYKSKWLGVAPKYESNLALRHNQAEVKALAQYANGKVLLGERAQKTGFVQQAADYQILHLAMHGFADPNDPAQAHLAFSSKQDQALYAWEIPYLHLKTDLVILSACESGYGKFQTGEGVMSLARAFSQAGCKSVINTLWMVDDAASQKINELFYPNLISGQNKATALQKAKISYLAEAPPHALHPHYWAAFVLTGSDSPLQKQAKPWYIWIGIALLIFGLLGALWKYLSNHARQAS